MFEVGKQYEFRLIEDGDEFIAVGVIEKYEHPLIKLQDSEPISIQNVYAESGEPIGEAMHVPSYPGRIINVTSPNFVSAVRKDQE